MRKFWLAAILFITLVPRVFAAVYINEFSSYQSSGDWIELYANTETDISGWILKDSSSEIKTIPSSTKIGTPSASILVVTVSNRLNREEDLIELYQNDGTTLADSISYGFSDAICAPEDNQSIGRKTDGNNPWVRFMTATQGNANTGGELSCPSSSPSPTATPTPTPTVTPTPTPIPTPKPSPSLKPSPSPSPSPAGEVAGTSAAEIDLSTFGISPSPSPTSAGEPQKLSLNQSRARTALVVGLGLILLSVAGFFGYRQYLRRQSLTDL